MSDSDKKSGKRKVSSLDVFVWAILILCIAGLAIRLFAGREGVLPEGAPESGSFAVSFEIAHQRASSGAELASGAIFYSEDGAVFGTLGDKLSVTPAKEYKENGEGKLTVSYSATEGDASFVDIRGVMTVEGYNVDYGFLAGGRTYVAPNYTIPLHTDTMSASVKITGIVKIGG